MFQSYLIFSDSRKLEILPGKRNSVSVKAGIKNLTLPKNDAEKITRLVKQWHRGNTGNLKLRTDDPAALFETVQSAFDQFIVAAGGLVTHRGKLLVIFRNGKWDLPKGKLEAGESMEDGAVREVKEETGLQKIVIRKIFRRTFHTYAEKNKSILKETIWYLMKASDSKLKPQTEEGITDARWISEKELKEISANTYDNIRLLVKAYFKKGLS